MTETQKIIKKWYTALNFPAKYDEEFYRILDSAELDTSATPDEYNTCEHPGGQNLLMQLYFLEEVKKIYDEHKIPDEIFFDTMADIVRWTNVWSDLNNELCMNELLWMKFHLTFRLFKIGRLQFCMQQFDRDYPEFGIKKGENFLDVHIPAAGPLIPEECEQSFRAAKEFFKKYFPSFEYRYFACFSWLLDDTLKKYMKPGSNTLKFQRLFTEIHRIPSDDILKFSFKWNTTRKNLPEVEAKNSFQARIKDAVSSGEQFYEVLGIIDSKNILA